MMGVDSVEYHRATVLARGDDHPGQALEYYGTRGETPLVWGGEGAASLGLSGAVTDEQYEAIFGPGGACDPTTGERLVNTRRPGLELVISAHKSVAELGVIGRADDMHKIMDAERDATLTYLDALTRELGGRRGRDASPSPTEGMVYAVTRHATSRAGDPCPHDHVLVANVLSMADEIGGWKAAHTALWRSHVHAATMVGRMAAARVAVEAGYAIVPDTGPSGKLGHWAIAGVPEAVMEAHSKRAIEIQAAMDASGYDSYRARNIAARDSRDPKAHHNPGELLDRWQVEIEAAGWSVDELGQSIDTAARARSPEAGFYATKELDRRLVAEALDPDGPLAARKVFARRDVIVALAPALYGRHPAELERLVARTLAHPEAVPLVGVAGALERPYATATTIAREQAIAAAVDRQVARTDASAVSVEAATAAIAAREAAMGHSFTAGQRAAIEGVLTSGRGAELIVGVAGAGKTTALSAARECFEDAGYTVLGTSASGQAARTLGREAGVAESRTLASLLWRIEHQTLRLTPGHIVFLDEGAMAEDALVQRILAAAELARSKVVMVGDPRQLPSVGPGGGFEGLVRRYGVATHILSENLRQHDPAERRALAELRSGDVAKAVSFYAAHGRIAVAPDRERAIDAAVASWAADVAEGVNAAMYAFRRANVAKLNRRGREVWAAMGRLTGPELVTGAGTGYRAGDRIVTLAPGARGAIVTSECGSVLAVDVRRGELAATMDDGRIQHFGPDEVGPDHLAHGYAVTVHRSQGATVGRAHVLEDGGGRELAYVKMSRARERTTLYPVADSVAQAVEDMVREWSVSRRLRWAIDTGTPTPDAELTAMETSPQLPPEVRTALRHARLVAEHDAVVAAVPNDWREQLAANLDAMQALGRRRQDLERGTGVYEGTAVGEAARSLSEARDRLARAEAVVHSPSTSWRQHRRATTAAELWRGREANAAERWQRLAGPEASRLDREQATLVGVDDDLRERVNFRRDWLSQHPEAVSRVQRLEAEIDALEAQMGPDEWRLPHAVSRDNPFPQSERTIERGIDRGLDLGIGL